MSKRRPERRVCVALVSALTAALFCVPISDAVANTPIGESVWRQAKTETTGRLSDHVDRRESDGFAFDVYGTPDAVTMRALPKLGGGNTYSVLLDPPGGADIVVGQVYPEGRIELDYSGCEDLSGAFQVHELEFDSGTGDITHFSATFQYFCGDSVPDGERFVATVAYEPTNGALPLPDYGSFTGEPLTKLNLRFDRNHIGYGQRAVAKGVLSERGSDSPLVDQRVVLTRYEGLNRWREVEATRTDSLGRYAFGFRPKKFYRYRVEFRGSSIGTESTSFERKVYVHHVVTARLSDSRVQVGEPLTVTGRVKPGDGDRSRVTLQERVDGSWVKVLEKSTQRDGDFRMRIVVNSRARVTLRVYCDPRPGLLQGVSDPMRLVAR